MFAGLANPELDDGEMGAALTWLWPDADGDRDKRSDARRSWGVELVYNSRVV